jgi:hypothetical protein
MKKFFVIALALIIAVGFAADAAFAGDLSVSGAMRVRAWATDNTDLNDAVDDEKKYWDQRFRVAATVTGAEGITGHLRFDFAEDTWADSDWATYRYGESSELQVDRAYLQVDQEKFKIKAGQQYIGLGNTIAYDNQQLGLLVDIKEVLPVTLTLGVVKEDEGDPLEDAEDDVDHYLVNVAYAADAFSLNVFAAMVQDQADDPDEPTMFGAQVKTTVAGFALNAEANMFSGCNDATDVDYVGTQLYVNAEKKVSDQLTAGLDVVFAQGTDDAGETQLTQIGDNFNDWTLNDRGPYNADISSYDDMDPTGTSGGSMGAGVYADYAAMEGLLVQVALLYLTIPENDASDVDSVMTYNLGLTYDLAPNTTLVGVYHGGSIDGGPDDLEHSSVMSARLQIKF